MEVRTDTGRHVEGVRFADAAAVEAATDQEEVRLPPVRHAPFMPRATSSKDEAAAVDALVDKLKVARSPDDANNETIETLLKELSKLPVKFVPIKLEQRIDYSKPYPYRSTKRGG